MPMKKFIGKPYAGKPHVRIDEGAGKGFQSFPLYSTGISGGVNDTPLAFSD